MKRNQSESNEVARYGDGDEDDTQINQKIRAIWADLVSTQADEVASQLDIPKSMLNAAEPPFQVETLSGGISGVEIAVIFISGAFGEFAKELGKDAAQGLLAKAKELWRRHIEVHFRDSKRPALGDKLDDAFED